MTVKVLCFDAYGLWGGGQKILQRDICQMTALGLDVVVVCPSGNVEAMQRNMPDITVVGVALDDKLSDFVPNPPLITRLCNLPALTYRLFRQFRRFEPSLAYALGSRSAKLILGATLLSHVPLCWSAHNLYKVGALDRLLIRHSLGVLCVSEAIRSQYVQAGSLPERLYYVPNSIDTKAYAISPPSLRLELGISEDTVLVGVVGRIGPAKGQRDFVEAMLPLMEDDEALHAVIVGAPAPRDEAYLHDLEARIDSSGVAERFHLTGWRQDIPEVMQSLDVLVLPSEAEPFGIVLLEAMACGKPVVAYRAGAVPEITVDQVTALHVPPGDIACLREAVWALVQDAALRTRLGQAGLERVRSQYDDAVVLPQVREFFSKMIDMAERK